MKQKEQKDEILDVNLDDNLTLASQSNETESSSEKDIMASIRKVSFHDKVSFSEPSNPWATVKRVSCVSELSDLYRESCEKHKTKPIDSVIEHLSTIDFNLPGRVPLLNLKEQELTANSFEALEEILKRVQYRLIDVSCCGLDDTSVSVLFDIIEYYEAACELDLSENRSITSLGWQACVNLIKRSHTLQILSVRATMLSDVIATSLGKAMLGSSLHTIKLEHCNLSGRPISSLCTALKRNTVLKELWLAYNDLQYHDAYNISLLLKTNFYIQILDVSNNYLTDLGVACLVEALIEQSTQLSKPPDEQRVNSFNSELSACLKNVQQPKIELRPYIDDEVFKITPPENNNRNNNEFNIQRKEEKLEHESVNKVVNVRSKLDALLTNLVVEPENTNKVQTKFNENDKQLITINEIPIKLDDINNSFNNNNNNDNEDDTMEVMHVEDIINKEQKQITDIDDIDDIELKITEDKDNLIETNKVDDACLISENVLNLLDFKQTKTKNNCTTTLENNLTIISKKNNNNLLDKNEILHEFNVDEKQQQQMDCDIEENLNDILSIDINENNRQNTEENNDVNNSSEIIIDIDKKDNIMMEYLENNEKVLVTENNQDNNYRHDDDDDNNKSVCINNLMDTKITTVLNNRDIHSIDDLLIQEGIKKPKLEIIYEHDSVLTTSNDSDILEKSTESSFEFLPVENLEISNINKIDDNNKSPMEIIENEEKKDNNTDDCDKIIDINDVLIELKSGVETANVVKIQTESDKISSDFSFEKSANKANILEQVFEKADIENKQTEILQSTATTACNYVKSVSHLPERSLSSDSLNSDTSIDSNDSKSSLKLAESKFSKNGTLERQSEKVYVPQTDQPTASRTGLQVLVLWNNHLTRHSSKAFSDLLTKTNTLEILNVGRNVLTNDFLTSIKPSLKTNTTLTNLGLQGAHLSCTGVKTLAEIIEFGGNSTLQRIDLRDNHIETAGLTALDEVLKSNKIVTRIDLDDIPHKLNETNGTSNCDYTRLVTNIRAHCSRNEKPPPEAEPVRSNGKKVRAEYLKSRKISLTCQSIRPTSTVDSVQLKPDRHLLDPYKKSAGRLRSPLPSPSQSPISSPTPSPSRSRFHVSRVPESSTSLSPVTPSSSTSSSPSSYSLTSRFRVTAVDIKPKSLPVVINTTTTTTTSQQQTDIQSVTNNNNNHNNNNKNLILPNVNITKSEPQKILNLSNKTQQLDSEIISNKIDFLCSSFDSPDMEVKRYMNDSCSSLSSMDSIDRPHDFNTSISSTDSSEILINPDIKINKIPLNSTFINDSLHDSFHSSVPEKIPKLGTNDDTLTNTSCGGTSEKMKSSEKRVRKTSWMTNTMGKSEEPVYPASIEKLLSIFTRGTENIPPTTRKDSSMGGLLSWMTTPKKIPETCELGKTEKSVLQQKSSDSNLLLQGQSISSVEPINQDDIQQEIKDDHHTLTASNIANINIELPIESTRVRFEVGGDDDDDEDIEDDSTVGETISTTVIGSGSESSRSNEQLRDSNQNNKLGQIARDSMSILKGNSNDSQDSMRSLEFDPID